MIEDRKALRNRISFKSCHSLLLLGLALSAFSSFAHPSPLLSTPESGARFLRACLKPRAEVGLVATARPGSERAFLYDNALVVLWLLSRGEREDAGKILLTFSTLQREDGALPFSIDAENYVRSGAVAWMGYAAIAYLDGAPDGKHRKEALRLAHGIAGYLSKNRKDGLPTGGEGSFVWEGTPPKEKFIPGPLTWISTEHGIDSYFFFTALAGLTGNARHERTAHEIARSLVDKLWNKTTSQFDQGIPHVDLALDCASWGSLFLLGSGDAARARAAFLSADTRYRAHDPIKQASGYRTYSGRKLVENSALAAQLGISAAENQWDRVEGVWPEGTAGMALAAWRLGRENEARAMLADLERLRSTDGGVPDFSKQIPMEFEAMSSVTGTAWIELVRHEIDSGKKFNLVWKETQKIQSAPKAMRFSERTSPR